MSYEFRPFNGTDEDYGALVAIFRVCRPEDPFTVEDIKAMDRQTNPDHLSGRHVCLHNGRIVGSGDHVLAHWYPTPQQFLLNCMILPEYEEATTASFLTYLKTELAPHNPQGYVMYVGDDERIQMRVLEADGFKITQRSPRLRLDVPAFDSTAYDALWAKLKAEGVEFVSLTTYKERDSEWVATYEEASWEMWRASESTTRPSLSEFEKQVSLPGHEPDGHIFALKAGEIVGVSSVSANPATKEKLYNGFTGVKQPYRRKGIATALKAKAIQFAQAYGAKTIETSNEESNPMYTLNLQLGFKPLPAQLEYKKQV